MLAFLFMEFSFQHRQTRLSDKVTYCNYTFVYYNKYRRFQIEGENEKNKAPSSQII